MTQITKYSFHSILFYFFVLLIPIQLGLHFWPDFAFVQGIRIDYLAPTLYATDFVIGTMFILWLFENNENKKSKLISFSLFTIIVVFLSLINILFAYIPPLAILKTATFIKLFLLGLYILKAKPNIKISIYCLTIAAVYSSFLAWGQFISQSSVSNLFWILGERSFTVSTPGIATIIYNGQLFLRPYATFPHPNVLAGFLVVTIPLIFFYFPKTGRVSMLKIPILLLLLSTLTITFSRSAWIAFVIMIVIWILKKRIKIRSFIALAAIMFALVFLPFISQRMFDLVSVDSQSIFRRVDLIIVSMQMIKDHTITGVGLNNFIPAIPKYMTISSYQDLQPVHNIYLLYVTETGLVGLLVLALAFFKLRKAFKSRLKSFNSPFMFSLFSLFINGLFDHYPYTIHQVQILAAVIIAFALKNKLSAKN